MQEFIGIVTDDERAMYGLEGARIEGCRFEGPADGESALKECRDIRVSPRGSRPVARVQPTKVMSRAASFTGVIRSRKRKVDKIITNTGEVYSSTAATDMELREMVVK